MEKPRDVGHFLVQKLSQNFDFCICPSHNALKRDAGGKKGKLVCCKCNFDQIRGNLDEIQPKNRQNVQKNALFAKSSRSQWVNTILIQLQLFLCYETHLFTEKFSWTTTFHPGIFGRRALLADSGPPRMNTIASSDQFKPIRIGENLVVNYNL